MPGTVLNSYMAAGAVPDIVISDNNQQVSESFFNSDFWYRGELKAEGSAGGRRLLIFDGINWKAEVYMNGHYVGRIDGAFKQAGFDVTGIAHDRNIVAVKFHSERGMPNVMSYASLKKTFTEENIWPIGDAEGSVISKNMYLRNFADGKNTGDNTGLPEETVEKVLAEALK